MIMDNVNDFTVSFEYFQENYEITGLKSPHIDHCTELILLLLEIDTN